MAKENIFGRLHKSYKGQEQLTEVKNNDGNGLKILGGE